MRYENISFPEALRRLAEKANILLPSPSGKSREGSSDNEKIFEIYQQAADFYHRQFLHPQGGKMAREYWKKRGFGDALASEFKIGWSPAGWSNLLEHLLSKGFPESLLLKTGLIQKSERGKIYDVFRERLLFPIHNLQGKIVAFGGRIIQESTGPKYLNSPENPIFRKRRELFGLYFSKRFIDRDIRKIIVAEGYLDYLRLYEKGFKTAVATLGTALTEEHVQVLKRFADEAVVVYDGDQAGEAATLRGLEVFLEQDMSVKIVRLPQGFDPDDFLHQQGAEAFQKLLTDATDFYDFQYQILSQRYNPKDPSGLLRLTGAVLETFSKIKNPIILDHYMKRFSSAVRVDEQSLRLELSKLKKKDNERARPAFAGNRPVLPAAASISQEELLLLALMVEAPAMREMIRTDLTEAEFDFPSAKTLFRLICEIYDQRSGFNWGDVLSKIEDQELKQKLISAAQIQGDGPVSERVYWDCKRKLRFRKIDRRLRELDDLIGLEDKDKESALLREYLQEYHALSREVQELKSRKASTL